MRKIREESNQGLDDNNCEFNSKRTMLTSIGHHSALLRFESQKCITLNVVT